jgi:hypothetical protein
MWTRILIAVAAAGAITATALIEGAPSRDGGDATPQGTPHAGGTGEAVVKRPPPAPIAPFVLKGIDWLVRAQHEDGGWGAGSHASQQIRDPHGVQTDPATTAFAGLALLRAGHTPVDGEHRAVVRRALEYLVRTVETAGEGPRITALEGTQPQAKMGPLVDGALALQFLSRAVPLLPKDDPLAGRAKEALASCAKKVQAGQQQDGSWGGGGWANVLQTSLNTAGLEMAQAAGTPVSAPALSRAREVLQKNLDAESGAARADAAAGIELYAWASAGRNAAAQSLRAVDLFEAAKREGRLPADARLEESTLVAGGASAGEAKELVAAMKTSEAQTKRLDDAQLLSGFGNNGGEEFLSYMMTSEALVIQGHDAWEPWNDKMTGLLTKVQSPDGSWTGHHCITSPVFCTAAVVQTLLADRDADVLRRAAAKPEAR